MELLPHTRSCFVCGESNPAGLNLRFETDGRVVRTRLTPRAEHIGFQGVIHGGIIATVLDETMVWACAAQTRRFAFCAELNVRFLKPVRPGAEIIVTAELAANRRNKMFEAKGELTTPSGECLATATGKYLAVPHNQLALLAADMVNPPAWIFEERISLARNSNPPLRGGGGE